MTLCTYVYAHHVGAGNTMLSKAVLNIAQWQAKHPTIATVFRDYDCNTNTVLAVGTRSGWANIEEEVLVSLCNVVTHKTYFDAFWSTRRVSGRKGQ